VHDCGLEPIATTDGCYPEVQGSVARVTTVVHQYFRSFVARSNLKELAIVRMVFTVMSAKPALAFL
jgi:hypothetical protein